MPVTAALLLALCTMLAGGQAQATQAQAREEALAIALLAAANGYEIQGGIGSHYLKLGEIGGVRAVLRKGRNYKIIVGGCNDAYDLDLVVVDENGNLIASDNEYAKHAEVDVRPRWTGEFGIYIKMTRGTADGAHFSLIIAYD
jgi:hypothetical protein